MATTALLEDLLVGAVLLILLGVAFELGFRLGLRGRASAGADPSAAAAAGQVGAIQGAVLGLLGLLLAFSFAAAGARFLEKQDLIVTEANAIGTATLRADLLDEPHRSELRAALRDYTEYRLRASAQLRSWGAGLPAEVNTEVDRQHARMWNAAVAGVRARSAEGGGGGGGGAILAVVDPVNEVIDLHSTRIAAGKKHLPMVVLMLLIACSLLAIGVIGYGSGMGGRRRAPLTLSLTMLVGASLWITIDLDHPRAGLLRLSDAPLKALKFDDTAR